MKSAVILAGGVSSRYGKDKLKEELFGKRLAKVSADAFSGIADEIIVVTDDVSLMEVLPDALFANKGATRAESVKNGLAKVSSHSEFTAVHDAARPFVSRELIRRLYDEAEKFGSAVPFLKVTDTVYNVSEGVGIIDRNSLVTVQTPQVFKTFEIKNAYAECRNDFTDDSGVYLARYGKVHFTEGSVTDCKVTLRGDLPQYRTGTGYDVHVLKTGRKLVLGGVTVPFAKGLYGHSDADVLLHAVIDALLSAAGQPDIGVLFPPDDDSYLNADSLVLMKKAADLIARDGWETVNVSAVIIAQSPKIAPYEAEMEQNIANVLDISASCVKISATTSEKLGSLGKGDGIAAQASVILARSEPTGNN